MDQQTEKRSDRKSNRGKQKNKRGDSKVESNDSTEIPDRGKHQTSPASIRRLWRRKAQPKSRRTSQQPSKKRRPSSRQGATLQVVATTTLQLYSREGILSHLVQSCSCWLVFAIWHGVRYGVKVFKNHPEQVQLDLWWPVCAKSNMAAARRSKCQIAAPVTIRAL